jgi:Tfp pilus assembly protein FimT
MRVLPNAVSTAARRPSFHKAKTVRLAVAAGLSLLELLVVVGIVLVVLGISVPIMGTAVRSVRLHGSAADYANLLQNARIRAVKDDKFYTVLVNAAANPPIAFVDINGSRTYDPGEPMTVFRADTVPAPFASGPALANLKSQFLPSSTTGQASLATNAAGPSFGARGLPCTPTGGTCPYLSPTTLIPTSYVTFIQGTNRGDWVAVTVTPAGRIREWSYNTNSSTWSPLD